MSAALSNRCSSRYLCIQDFKNLIFSTLEQCKIIYSKTKQERILIIVQA